MNKLSLQLLCVFCICAAFCPVTVRAQATSGDLTGTVFDASGATIPNATVIALNDATGVKSAAQTNAGGVYRFTNLPIGRYTLLGSASGFSSNTLKNVDLTLNNTITANLTLEVGKVGTS